MKSVVNLRIYGVTFPSFAHFTRVLQSFRNLSSLLLEEVSWQRIARWPHLESQSCLDATKINKLYLFTHPERMDDIVIWLSGTAVKQSLDALLVRNHSAMDPFSTVFSIMWSSWGDSLRNLTLSFGSVVDHSISLESLTNLRSITLDLWITAKEIIPELSHAFESITSQVLEEVTIYLHGSDYGPVSDDDTEWKSLDEVLANKKFQFLRNVSFALFCEGPQPPLDFSMIHAKFPKLRTRGIIYAQWYGPADRARMFGYGDPFG